MIRAAALREMILPGLITIITPVLMGLIFGAEPLGGYMAGVCVSGVMWAIFQNNAALVEISTHLPYSGLPVPSRIPGISLN